MYKLIVSDLDETLLDSHSNIPEANIEAIKKLKDLGIKFVPASGRGYASIQGTLEDLGLKDQENEYIISFNGSAITENKGNKLLHEVTVPKEYVKELVKRGIDLDIPLHVYTTDQVYIYKIPEMERKFLDNKMDYVEVDEDELNKIVEENDIVKVLYISTDFDYLKEIEKQMEDLLDEIDITFSSNRYIEFNRKGINKGAGLHYLIDLLGIKPEEVIAIGDNFNDLPMLLEAGLAVGVNNVVDGMKEYCDYITEKDHNEGAVAEVIDKFILEPLNND